MFNTCLYKVISVWMIASMFFNKFGTLSLFGEFVRLFIREVEEGGSLDESLVDDSTNTITPCFFGSNIECHFCQWIWFVSPDS